MKNVICIHEQDEGLGWIHTNFRTGRPSVVRGRVLVVQMVITVANYGPFPSLLAIAESTDADLASPASRTCRIRLCVQGARALALAVSGPNVPLTQRSSPSQFDQAAAFHLETRATGILSTCAILPGESSPYGNVVNPGVLATNHQHLCAAFLSRHGAISPR